MTLVESGAAVDPWVTEPGAVGYVLECDVAPAFPAQGVGIASADMECEHGRLAGDSCPSPVPPRKAKWTQNWPHPHPCGCWASELPKAPLPEPELLEPASVTHATTPDLMSILTRREPLMLTAPPERTALPPGPPYGYKLDGSPRKSRAGRPPNAPKPVSLVKRAPQREPVSLVKPNAESIMRDAIMAAANVAPPAPVKPTTVVHLTTGTLLDRIVRDIDAEIARLQAARDALTKVIA